MRRGFWGGLAVVLISLSVGAEAPLTAVIYRGQITAKKRCRGDIIRGPSCELVTLPFQKNCEISGDPQLHFVDIKVEALRELDQKERVERLPSQGLVGENMDRVMFGKWNSRTFVFARVQPGEVDKKPLDFELRANYRVENKTRSFQYESYLCSGLSALQVSPKAKPSATPKGPNPAIQLKKKNRN